MKSFTIQSCAPYSLNYLIYIQNAYLGNQRNVKFPHLDISRLGLLEEKLFCDGFKKVWEEMIQRISENLLADHNGILITEEKLFKKLFVPDNRGMEGFRLSRESFHAWFSSLAGQRTIERAAEHIMYYENDIYNKLSQMINNKNIQKLHISLIYDECILGSSKCFSGHSIISLREIYGHYENKNLISIIAKSLE